jgi:hypothetical protein
MSTNLRHGDVQMIDKTDTRVRFAVVPRNAPAARPYICALAETMDQAVRVRDAFYPKCVIRRIVLPRS